MCFPDVLEGPGGFRKVREADRNNFLDFSSKMHLMVTSYDQKTKKVHATTQLTTIGNYEAHVRIDKELIRSFLTVNRGF